jgi:hypothetical protein
MPRRLARTAIALFRIESRSRVTEARRHRNSVNGTPSSSSVSAFNGIAPCSSFTLAQERILQALFSAVTGKWPSDVAPDTPDDRTRSHARSARSNETPDPPCDKASAINRRCKEQGKNREGFERLSLLDLIRCRYRALIHRSR